MTRGEVIVQRVMEILSQVGYAPVYRERVDGFRSNEMPAVAVYDVKHDPDPQMSHCMRWRMQLVIEVFDKGSQADQDVLHQGGFPPSGVADSHVANVYRLMMKDHILGGLCEYVSPAGIEKDIARADNDIAAVRMGFEISYKTAINDLEIAA